MARSHAKILVQVWRDRDWTAMSPLAQWLYVLILTQPQLTLVGSLDISTGRWAALASGLDRAAVEGALDELRDAGKVLVDDTTDELLIRTFTAHDIDPNRVNVNLAKGLWGQWACIASDRLRRVAITLMPQAVWDKLEQYAPSDALYIRRSARLEPGEFSRSQPQRTPRLEPPPSSHLPPDDSNRPDVEPSQVWSMDNFKLGPSRIAALEGRSRQHIALVSGENPAAGGERSPVHPSRSER